MKIAAASMLLFAVALPPQAIAAPVPAPAQQEIRGQGLATSGAERFIDPTWLKAYTPQLPAGQGALSSTTVRYKPVFGEGAAYAAIPRGISRYGEVLVSAGGRSATARYAREEHLMVVLEGEGTVVYGGQQHPVKAEDFLYLPPGVEFGLNSRNNRPVRAILMGFKVPEAMRITTPATFQIANFADVGLQLVGGHPPSTLYRLLMGDTTSTRDRLRTGHIMKSLYIMEFDPGGTNFPHHHEHEEEIYLLINGEGEMVAGSGADGVQGRYPARMGDAYYYRANTTVGFYNDPSAGQPKARILAVRSTAPLRKEGGGE